MRRVQERLRGINPEYSWTETTALTLAPAIDAAKKGKNVLVMSYGTYREHRSRGGRLRDDIPWLSRWETLPQKVVASLALAGFLTAATYASYGIMFEDPHVFNGFAVTDKDGKNWVSRLNR